MSDAHARRIADLFQAEHERVVHYLLARVGSGAEARDIAAQAFKQLLEVNPESVNHWKAYVYKVATNIAINRGKLAALRRRLEELARFELTNCSPSPEPQLAHEQRLQVLQEAIGELNPRCRMALVLRVWDELSYAEILSRFAAQGVIINERTLRRWLAHAYEHCRHKIVQAEQSGCAQP